SLDTLSLLLQAAVFHNQVAWVWRLGGQMLTESTFDEFLSSHETDLIEALFRTLDSKSCFVGNISGPGGDLYKGRWPSSIESRAKLVADVVGKLRSELSLNLMADMIQTVRGRITERE